MSPWKKAVATVSLIGCLSLTACVTEPPIGAIPANPTNPIRTVAVLPLINDTNDVDGPMYVREKLTKELESYHYAIKPMNEVDQILKEQMGITLGSQLDLTTPQKLCELLGVDGVFYGSLDDFSHKVLASYDVRRVRIRMKLVDCKTGQTVWKNGIGVKLVIVGALGIGPFAVGEIRDKQDTGEGLRPLLGDTVKVPWFRLPNIGLPFGPVMDAARLASKDKKLLRDETQWAIQIAFKGACPTIESQSQGGEVLNVNVTVSCGTPLPPGPGN